MSKEIKIKVNLKKRGEGVDPRTNVIDSLARGGIVKVKGQDRVKVVDADLEKLQEVVDGEIKVRNLGEKGKGIIRAFLESLNI